MNRDALISFDFPPTVFLGRLFFASSNSLFSVRRFRRGLPVVRVSRKLCRILNLRTPPNGPVRRSLFFFRVRPSSNLQPLSALAPCAFLFFSQLALSRTSANVELRIGTRRVPRRLAVFLPSAALFSSLVCRARFPFIPRSSKKKRTLLASARSVRRRRVAVRDSRR